MRAPRDVILTMLSADEIWSCQVDLLRYSRISITSKSFAYDDWEQGPSLWLLRDVGYESGA